MNANKALLWDYVTKELMGCPIIESRDNLPDDYLVAKKLCLHIQEVDVNGGVINDSINAYIQSITYTIPFILQKASKCYSFNNCKGSNFTTTNITIAELKDDGTVILSSVDSVDVVKNKDDLHVFNVLATNVVDKEERHFIVTPYYKEVIFETPSPHGYLGEKIEDEYKDAIESIKKESAAGRVYVAEDDGDKLELVVMRFGDKEVLHLDGCSSAFDNYDYVTNFPYIFVNKGLGYIVVGYISNVEGDIGYKVRRIRFDAKDIRR